MEHDDTHPLVFKNRNELDHIELDERVKRTLPLERINEAFELMHQSEVIRSVIRISTE